MDPFGRKTWASPDSVLAGEPEAPLPASEAEAEVEVPSLLGQMVSGNAQQQAAAARRLEACCRLGPRVRRAVRGAGGVHMLLMVLDARDEAVRWAALAALAALAEEAAVRAEVVGSQGGASRAVAAACAGVAAGQPAAGRLLAALAAGGGVEVQAACCRAQAVPTLARLLRGAAGSDGTSTAKDSAAAAGALAALGALCLDEDSAHKLVWAGGLEALGELLQSGDAELRTPAVRLAALAARGGGPSAVAGLCSPAAVRALCSFVGAPDAEEQAQACAAELLASVAAAPAVRDGVRAALADHALPRAAEVLHRSGGGAAAGARQAASGSPAGRAAPPPLVASCAAVVAHAAVHSTAARAVVVLHAGMLAPTLAALCASHQYALAQQLLAAAAVYARGPATGA